MYQSVYTFLFYKIVIYTVDVVLLEIGFYPIQSTAKSPAGPMTSNGYLLFNIGNSVLITIVISCRRLLKQAMYTNKF